MKKIISALALPMAVLFACSSAGGPGFDVSLTPVDALDLPCAVDSLRALGNAEVPLALGEDESLALLMRSEGALDGAGFTVEGLPPGVSAETFRVTRHTRKVRGGQVTEPYFLEPAGAVSIGAGETELCYVTFHAGERAVPGTYDLTVRAGPASAPVRLRVRPFSLREPDDFFFGAFCGDRDIEITPAHLRDLHRRHFDALQFFWGSVSVGLDNDNGELAIDFSTVDKWMEDLERAGLDGPVVWSMGNDYRSHMENELARLFDLPKAEPRTVGGKTTDFADITNPKLNSLLEELFLAIKEHREEMDWPEIVFIIYDEPTERLMEEHEDRYRLLERIWPGLRIYGIPMNRIEWARDIAHMVDIFVANGDFPEISALADSLGKGFWLYGSGSSRDAASLRHRYAWTAWANNAGASWFWAYNYGVGDLYDDFDGRLAETSARMVWPPREPGGELVVSVSWDGMREAADDIWYVKTLEWMLGRSRSDRAAEIRGELEAIREAVPSGRTVRVLGGDEHDRVQVLEGRKYVVGLRERIAGWIEELLGTESDLYGEIRPL